MTFGEFKGWCYQRVCDGCWGRYTAIYCIETIAYIDHLPFWKRKKAWIAIKDFIETNIVSVINKKIQQTLKKEKENENGAGEAM